MPIKDRYKRNVLIYLCLSLLIALFAIFYTNFVILPSDQNQLTKNLQSTLIEKEKSADKYLDHVLNRVFTFDEDSLFVFEDFTKLLNDEGFLILVYRNDYLRYWSDNSIPVSEKFNSNGFNECFSLFSNGWFDIRKKEQGSIKVVCLIKVKSDYIIQNQYLKNEFQSDFKLPNEVLISQEETNYKIFNKENDYLFSLVFPDTYTIDESQILLLTTLYLIAFILLIIALYYAYLFVILDFFNSKLLIIGFILDLLLIRFLIFYFKIPAIVYSSKLFSPLLFANSNLIPSLGDLLINSVMLLSISFVVFQNFNFHRLIFSKSQTVKYVSSVGVLLIIFFVFIGLSVLLKSIVINSSVSYDLNDITGIDVYSIMGFVCFGMLIFSFVFLTFRAASFVALQLSSYRQFFPLLISIQFLFYFIAKYVFNCDSFLLVFLFVYLSAFWVILKSHALNIRFSSTMFFIVLFSLFSTYILYEANTIREKQIREIIVQRLSQERDPAAEYLFGKVVMEIQKDTAFKELADRYFFSNEGDLDEAVFYLGKTFFSNYWNRYDLLITLCDSSRVLDIQPEDYMINCYDYFQNIVEESGSNTDCPNLYYLSNEFSARNYIGLIQYELSEIPFLIIVEVYSKIVPKGLGYPELLIDQNEYKSNELSEYSWARYEDSKLVYHFGKYFYSMNLSSYGQIEDDLLFFNRNSYNHLYNKIDEGTTLIISRKNPGFLGIVAPFSYFFIFYGIFVFLVFLLFRSPIDLKLRDLNFKKRLQLSITALIVVSFLFIGLGSLFYIVSLNNSKNNDILSEKAHSVLIELEHKLAAEESLSHEMEQYMSDLLYKFSLVFFTDINLYDLDGNLLATSRSEIFNKGLISAKMNSAAFNYMSNYRKSLFIHHESIGQYNYLSAYLPFRNEQNNLIAYLNLPYFAKQDELTNEISTYLVAFINIYVILIAFAIFIALVISNYITKPLQIIKEKISRLKIGTTNEKIDWSRNDEIGSLVMEYNRMVDELANSVSLLAKSERESAWREMAKQIAHEIKNPLTPMKLSVQYLQKSWDEKTPDWDQQLKRFTQTIIEQIESLSIIASEFSDFAKMPKSKFERVDICEVIDSSIGLFKNTTEIKFEFQCSMPCFAWADKEQLLRVFNNLIKNSIQAIINSDQGLIKISVSKEKDLLIVEFSDNGQGIPEDQIEKVFYPNFTTKSGGMGLGLAMVKNIIQNAKGSVSFESEEGKGTTFVISLPEYIN
ncbi:MAG: HAMP domain-containing sensor histidine kinase [Bacteroidales bacterium]